MYIEYETWTYDILLDGLIVGRSEDMIFSSEEEAKANANNFIKSCLIYEYDRTIREFEVQTFKRGESKISMTQREFAETSMEYRKEKAREISKQITIRSYIDGNSKDETRPTTNVEADVLYKLALGAMGAYGYRSEESGGSIDSIMDTMEMTCHQFIPECNAYDSLYIPVKKALGIW